MRKDFQLNEAQQARLEAFIEWCGPDVYEEGVAPMSPFIYVFRPGSIGDDIVVYCGDFEGPHVDLSMDDDGQFMKPANWLRKTT